MSTTTAATAAIVEDSAGTLYRIADAGPGLEHTWVGTPVKRVGGRFMDRANAVPRLIRRVGCRVVVEAV